MSNFTLDSIGDQLLFGYDNSEDSSEDSYGLMQQFKLFPTGSGHSGRKWWVRSARELNKAVVQQVLGKDPWMYSSRWKKTPCGYVPFEKRKTKTEVLGRPPYRRYPGNWCHVAYQQIRLYRKATEGAKNKSERKLKKISLRALKNAGIPTGEAHFRRLERNYNRRCAGDCNAPYLGKSSDRIEKRDLRKARRKRRRQRRRARR